MKRLLFPLCFVLACCAAFAQTGIPLKSSGIQRKLKSAFNRTTATPPSSTKEKCGFVYQMSLAKARGFDGESFERRLTTLMRQKATQRTAATVYTVPVIFHVLHRGQAVGTHPNMSAAQVAAQIDQMNKDFANLSGSAYGVAADAGIRFCAAVVDPYGRPLAEAGIQRINAATNNWTNTGTLATKEAVQDYFETVIKPASVWDPYSYLNVWTATLSDGLLGYATFPGLSGVPGLDDTETDASAGVVVEANSVGSVSLPGPGTGAPYNLGRTLTHEVGHFFGLRHVWGDAVCGNDYCDDTPQQRNATGGCPSTPEQKESGCVAGEKRMFENYMDYSNDACMNTFTANQGVRIQAVMANSPRRLELGSSKACQARAGNAVQFGLSKSQLTETGTSGTCPVIKTIAVSIAVSVQATGAATLTFNTTGTASNGADFTVSPSSVNFTSGDASLKTVNITIIDDKAIESPETIVLGYSISGAGVVAGPEKQTLTLTLIDNDFERRVNNNGAVTLLSQNFEGGASVPANWFVQNGYTNGWTVSANGGAGTTGNAAHITQDAATGPNTYNKDAESEAYLVTPLIDASGLSSITASFKWRCGGETPEFDAGYIGYILESDPTTVNFFSPVLNGKPGNATQSTFTLPTFLNNSRFYFVFYWYNDEALGNDPGLTIDDVLITGNYATVGSTVNKTVTQPHYAGQTAQYITADNQIITKVSGMSQNVGCITATIQNEGTGRASVQTANGSYFRSNKVIRLTPATANTSASYLATFYFTPAELSAWSPSELPNLKLMKVRDGVSLAGTITAADARVVPATFADNTAGDGFYTYTGSFTDGFSQFMLVSPNTTLPVGLLTFEAQPQKKSIGLNWKTATERNNKGFTVERSTDGINFAAIGWVKGFGNSDEEQSYRYTDNFVQPATAYYYRLNQVDLDNRSTLSQIRQAKLSAAAEVSVTISPNPAKGRLSVFVSGGQPPADISLVNAKGQTVSRWRKVNLSSPYSINTGRFAAGIYTVVVHLPGGDRVQQVILE